MTVKKMKNMSKLYNDFQAIETSVDLQRDNLSLSDYNELERVLILLSTDKSAYTRYSNVVLWIKRVNITIIEKNGYYLIKL